MSFAVASVNVRGAGSTSAHWSYSLLWSIGSIILSHQLKTVFRNVVDVDVEFLGEVYSWYCVIVTFEFGFDFACAYARKT